MAVNTFTFGNVTSSTYGIYVSGEGLFNAPVRSAEVISIPGRNGAYILDEGKFENIEVTYRVFNQEKNLNDFRTKLANFRNALCSQVGYQRLTDTFHPNEYRMAAFIDGVEVKPVEYNTASEFEIKFNCKPQRFLTSGETATTVANNGTLTNPTLFEAEPLLAVKGYGDVSFNGYTINLQTTDLGDIVLLSPATSVTSEIFDGNVLNNGDSIKIQGVQHKMSYAPSNTIESVGLATMAYTKSNADCSGGMPFWSYNSSRNKLTVTIEVYGITATYGTTGTLTATATVPCKVNGSWTNYTFALQIQVIGSNINLFHQLNGGNMESPAYSNIGEVDAYSTKSALGNPTYIDCEIGECYKLVNGEIVTLNHLISLGSDLPKLSTGTNTFTKDNTITELKVTPNWWQV